MCRTECEADCVRWTIAHGALAKDLHADDTGTGLAHLLDDTDHRIGVGIHVGTDRVEADEIDIDPVRCRGSGPQRLNGVAGDTVRTDDALLLGLGKHVHDAAILRDLAIGGAQR